MIDTPQKMTYKQAKDVFDKYWLLTAQLHTEKEKEKNLLEKMDACDKAIEEAEARYKIFHDAKEYREDVNEEEKERADFSTQLCEVKKIVKELEPQVEQLKNQLIFMQPEEKSTTRQTDSTASSVHELSPLSLFDMNYPK